MPGFLKYIYICLIDLEHRFLYACQAYAIVLIFHLHLEFWNLGLILFPRLTIYMKLILPGHSESLNSKHVTILLPNVLILNFYEQIWFFCPCACLCTTWIRMLALHSSQKMASLSLQLGVMDSCEPRFKYWPLNHLCARLAGDLQYWTICPPLCSLLITTFHC